MFFHQSQTITISDATQHSIVFPVAGQTGPVFDSRFSNWAFIITGNTNATAPTITPVFGSSFSVGVHQFPSAGLMAGIFQSTDLAMAICTLVQYTGKIFGITQIGVSIAYAVAPSAQNLTIECFGYPDAGARS